MDIVRRKLTLVTIGAYMVNTEERAHGTIHIFFSQTPHEYLLHMFQHLLIVIQIFHTGV